MTVPNSQYNVAKSDSLAIKVATYQRRRMYEHFLASTGVKSGDGLLDVGVTSERTYESSNYLEAWYPHKSDITAVGVDDASHLEAQYPGVSFVQGDGRDLPFADAEFDIVHSSAVLEHVGNRANQIQFVSECARVARRSVYITTPNRWFPVEFHTVLPLVHWLPKAWFRELMRSTGREFFAEEANLNLLGARDLREVAKAALTPLGYAFSLSSVSLVGWPSNLLLVATRSAR